MRLSRPSSFLLAMSAGLLLAPLTAAPANTKNILAAKRESFEPNRGQTAARMDGRLTTGAAQRAMRVTAMIGIKPATVTYAGSSPTTRLPVQRFRS